MKSQKGFVPVIIVLVVLIGFVGVYFLGTLKNKTTVVSPTSVPNIVINESSVPSSKPVATNDPTYYWKTYSNTKFNYSLKIPSDWVGYTMKDFSIQNFTGLEDTLYLGPRETTKRPPQLIQITGQASGSADQEVFDLTKCTVTNVYVGTKNTNGTHTKCPGLETNGFITIKTNNFKYTIDELKGTDMDHQVFNQIISTIEFGK